MNRGMMKRLTWLLLLALLLGGCTGTQEASVSTLLLVGYEDAASGGALALVEDLGDIEQGFNFLENSVRFLNSGVPIDYTIVDRTNTRRQLVVLNRDDATTGSPAALTFFNIGSIDPNNPVAFAPAPPFAAPSLGAVLPISAVDTSDFPGGVTFCPTAVATSTNGRFIALLNDQSVCNDVANARDAVDVIDLQATSGPTLIARVDIAVVASAFHLSQGPNDRDRLYYFINTAGGARLQYLALDPLGPNDNLLPVDTGVTLDLRANDMIRDLGLVNLLDNPSDVALVALLNTSFFPILGLNATPTPVATTYNNQELILDDYGETNQLLILNNNRLTVFAGEEADGRVTYGEDSVLLNSYVSDPVDGTVESFNQFAYIVGEGGLAKFDVLAADSSDNLNTLIGGADVPEITNPVFITWVRAVTFADAPQP